MLLEILQIMAPIAALAAVGYAWGLSGAPYDIPFVTRLAMNVSGPCLLFSTLATVDLDPRAFEAVALASLALYAALGLAIALIATIGQLSLRVYLAPLTFGNTGNIGLPLCLYAFGPEGLAYGLVIFSVTALLAFTVGVWLVSGEASPAAALRQPIFYGAALGAAWGLLDGPTPKWLIDPLSLLGQVMIPMMLVTLGVAIHRLAATGLAQAVALSAGRVGVAAVAAVAVADAFGLEGVARGALILQAVAPVAVTSYLLAERYDAGPSEIAGMVVVSTTLSIIVLPTALAFVLPGAA